MTQAAYARHRGVSKVTVHRRTVTAGGPVPVYGAKKLVKVAEADALWHATMSERAAALARAATADRVDTPPPSVAGHQLAQARAAALVVDVQTKRLTLEQRRGALVSRDRAVLKAFAFSRLLRDSWLNWPARVGPILAAALEIDATALTLMLEDHVRQHLADLARERPDF